MSKRLYADASRVAIYEEAPGGGDPLNPNSLMNRPVVNPSGWLSSVYFHSDLDYYNTFAHSTVWVAHPAVGGQTVQVTPHMTFAGRFGIYTHHLLTHNLGYAPKFFVAYGGRMLPHGFPVQDAASSRKRFVTAYATSSIIGLYELAVADESTLPAATLPYDVLVFANSDKDPALPNLDIQPGQVVFGQGKFRLDRPPLRVVAAGESPFVQALSKTAAVSNGALRVYPPNGSPLDFGPFNGSLPAPSFYNIQAGR